MSQSLIIRSFNKNGELFLVPYIYASDLEDEPINMSFEETGSKELRCPLTTQPIFLNALWEVEGFGRLILTADNEGKGYSLSWLKENPIINLNLELARSHLNRVLKAYRAYVDAGYHVSKEVASHLEESEKCCKSAEAAPDKCSLAVLSDKSLYHSLWAGEKLALEIAASDIERFRKVNFTVKVLDSEDRPVPNVSVVVRQISHDVLFACHARFLENLEDKLRETYSRIFKELFNAGAVNFFWPTFEPEEGKYLWSIRDKAIDWLLQNGLRVWGHLLIWLHVWSVPEWAKSKSYEELKEVLRKLCLEVAKRYAGKVKIWNVYNEPEWGNVMGLSLCQQIELLEIGINSVKSIDPQADTMINFTNVWGEYAAWGSTAEGPSKRRLLTPFQFLKEVEKRRITYDSIGLQLYMGFGGLGSGFSIRDMFTISRLIDKYSTFGKPIHITELGVPSSFSEDEKAISKEVEGAGYWHEPWNESIQADWIEQFYTIAFSKPSVISISWFDLADYERRFVPWGGLIREDGSPKTSYFRLKRLLDSWTTNAESITDCSGECSFKGFKGRYEVKVLKNGVLLKREEVALDSERKVTVKIGSH
ncbi:MAG: endo-1,4-beta-xylanase [Thermoproteota archaeon]|nr:endo-1,4-beta-xylanase [Candidatus Brockarchaeota archaeon]